jgi:hypothetical protein
MSTITLDMNKQKVVLNMSKTFSEKMTLNMTKQGVVTFPVLRTRAAIDASGSMEDNFRSGYVQVSLDRFLASALKFDDDQKLEVGWFNTAFTQTDDAVLEDAGVYLTTKARRIGANGGTEFAPIVEWTLEDDTREGAPAEQVHESSGGFFGGLKKLFGSAPAQASVVPVESALPDCGQYTGIITDGSLNSKSAQDRFESALRKTDAKDSFFQFIGLGSEVDIPYLTDVSARFPNVGFVHVPHPDSVGDDAFYELLANAKFVSWVKQYNEARGVK